MTPRAQEAALEDAPALKALWKTVFGDPDSNIELFFDLYFSPERTRVVKDGKTPVSAAYILPAGSFALPDGMRTNCAMLYAIATLPGYKGRGFGSAVTESAAAHALEGSYSAVVLKPADAGLFKYYEKRLGFLPFFEAVETTYDSDQLPAANPGFYLSPADPGEYRRVRQILLNSCIYIDIDERALSYQQQLCRASGGDLYIIKHGGNDIGCAAVEPEAGSVHVKELLLSNGAQTKDAVRLLAGHHPANRYIVRYPTNVCPENSRPFGMILPIAGCLNSDSMHYAKWYGPAFD